MSLREIPIIDIGGLFGNDVKNEQNVIEQVQYACKNYGFFYISNHHIDQNLIKEFRESIENFFKLPKEIKNLCRRTRTNSRGYYDEELTKTILDWKEVFDIGAQDGSLDKEGLDGYNMWPREPLNFEKVMREWFSEMVKLSDVLLEAIAKSLGWSSDTFEKYYELKHTSLLRLNHYPICPDPDKNMGVHHHTDAGALTILLQDDGVNSLRVYHNNEWISVPPKENTFVINIGDMMQVWTNDKYKAALHQVISNNAQERFSAPFFYNPSYAANIHPLTMNEKPLYKTINWGLYRSERAAGDYANYGEEIQIVQFRLDK